MINWSGILRTLQVVVGVVLCTTACSSWTFQREAIGDGAQESTAYTAKSAASRSKDNPDTQLLARFNCAEINDAVHIGVQDPDVVFDDDYIGQKVRIQAGLKKDSILDIDEVIDGIPFVTIPLDTKLGYTVTHAISSMKVRYPIHREDDQWGTRIVRISIMGMKKMLHNAERFCKNHPTQQGTQDTEPTPSPSVEPEAVDPVDTSVDASVVAPPDDNTIEDETIEDETFEDFGDFDEFEDFE